MYALVLIEYPVKSLDKTFTYKIPDNLKDKLKKGMKVLVPFNTKEVFGFVLNIVDETDYKNELLDIVSIVNEDIILNEELLSLGKHISKTTLAPMISVYNSMFPPSLKVKNVKTNYNLYETFYSLNKPALEVDEYILKNKSAKRQIDILNTLKKKDLVSKNDLNYPSSLKILLEKGLIKETKKRIYRLGNQEKEKDNIVLTKDQEYIVNNLELNNYNVNLLYGVTGSGKTEVYINLIKKVLENNKTALMLVPEISLTMQIVKRFYDKFGDKVAIFHSALSDGEKHDEYLKIIKGKVKIVVGTRSAVFTPLKNIGIIIIDEEHSSTYKQETTPKYNAIDVAKERCSYHNAPLLLGSATPSMESMARAITKRYNLYTIEKRVNKSVLPKVVIIDKEKEIKSKFFFFSNYLKERLNEVINNNEQAIILLNRRGYSTFVSCSNCGYTYKCPNCDITLTYHKSTNNLICHYCSYLKKKEDLCPECKNDSLTYLGLGTEKLETILNKEIKNAKILRMDQDTTTKKGSHDKLITSFKNNEYNILLGTQMISKGLDFDNVTLVAVINADNSLNIPDFRANENTFSLLNQTAGRSGRREKQGEVIIETFNPELNIFKHIKNNDYLNFFKEELDFRKKLKYPPFYNLISIKVISKDYHNALSNSQEVIKYLKTKLDNTHIILGPTTHSLFKLKNEYRFQIIIKYKNNENIYKILKDTEVKFSKTNLRLDIDTTPLTI